MISGSTLTTDWLTSAVSGNATPPASRDLRGALALTAESIGTASQCQPVSPKSPARPSPSVDRSPLDRLKRSSSEGSSETAASAIVRPERIVHTEFFGEGESLVTSSITAKGDTTTLTMTMRFASRVERDGALETGMADGVAVGYDRLDEILASAATRK